MQATEDKTYNGWTNYATWGVALVLDNDEGTYNEVRERASQFQSEAPEAEQVTEGIWTAEQYALFTLAEFLKDFTNELCGLEDSDLFDIPQPTLMAQQVLSAGLAEVDWDEIARNVLSEF